MIRSTFELDFIKALKNQMRDLIIIDLQEKHKKN